MKIFDLDSKAINIDITPRSFCSKYFIPHFFKKIKESEKKKLFSQKQTMSFQLFRNVPSAKRQLSVLKLLVFAQFPSLLNGYV